MIGNKPKNLPSILASDILDERIFKLFAIAIVRVEADPAVADSNEAFFTCPA